MLDGFFDFTPVQGEILKRLMPQIPKCWLTSTTTNATRKSFCRFRKRLQHLSAIAPFEIKQSADEVTPTHGALSGLRESLFNPALAVSETAEVEQSEIRYFECGDRDTEIRAVAKEIKRLVLRRKLFADRHRARRPPASFLRRDDRARDA